MENGTAAEHANEAIDLVTDKLQSWLETLIQLLPNLVVALVVVVVFWLLSRAARGLTRRALAGVSDHRAVANLFTSIVGAVVLAVGVFIGLKVLTLDGVVTSLLAGAGVIGLALGFAFQDIAANFMSGILMSIRRPLAVGEFVETNGFTGTVEDINMRSTHLRSVTGQVVILPNKEIFENPIVNFTRGGSRRVDLDVGVSYGDDLALAKSVAREVAESLESRDTSRQVDVFYYEMGGSSINLRLRFWIAETGQLAYYEAMSEAIERVKSAFDAAELTIPFPIRTLDFGIHGGERLDAMLAASRRTEDPNA
ncbi:MAG: mechanosensitive ion channel family protein [Acidobacteriota bacterium]